MNTWLVGFNTETSCVEMATHVLIQAESLALAEAGALYMGRTWWPDCRSGEEYAWQYPDGIVWLNSILLLDDDENTLLRGLKFLDGWVINGTAGFPDRPG